MNVGRATGGLVDQIDNKCGFLYKENSSVYTLDTIQAFIDSSSIVQSRKTNTLAQSMSDNLYKTLKKAINIYQNKPDKYHQMIINGFKKAQKFNWESSAKQYNRIYKMISTA